MDCSSLFLNTGKGYFEVRVHPLVVVSILDHYTRRKPNQTRVIGSLLGTNINGRVEITDTFPVPHEEKKEVRVDFDFQTTMRELHRRTSPQEVMVGWYASGPTTSILTEASSVIHEFFWKEMGSEPVHLTIDPNYGSIHAFACSTFKVPAGERLLASYFRPIQCEYIASEMERVGMSVLSRTKDSVGSSVSLNEANSIDSSYDNLLGLIDTVLNYVQDVISGKKVGDPQIGREIANVAQLLPVLQSGELEKITSESLQDVLMVAYVANLMKAQLSLAERLRQALTSSSSSSSYSYSSSNRSKQQQQSQLQQQQSQTQKQQKTQTQQSI